MSEDREVDDVKLAAVLADFAHTMLGDFRIQTILDRLVERVVDVLPVSGAGVTLIGADLSPHHVAASDPQALRYERLQTDLGQGPCLTAFESGLTVAIPDLAVETRYPQFTAAACQAGLAAVYTVPLRSGDGPLGALDLYQDLAHGLDTRTLAAAATLADVTSAYLHNATARQHALDISDDYRTGSLHDALTGLPNRTLLRERLEHAAHRAHRSHGTCAVLFTDLDRFKPVNDTYGHAVGDQLLVAVAGRLAGLVRPGDTLARVSGDEFVFLCEDLTAVGDAELLARRVTAAFIEPFRLPTADIVLSASVGIAYAGPGEVITPQLVVDADTAMYQAKRSGGGTHQIIDLPTARAAHERDALGHDLRTALAGPHPGAADPGAGDHATQGRAAGGPGTHAPGTPRTATRTPGTGLALAYQPIVDLADSRVVGVEALLRWTHPRRGLIPAPAAIGAAERHGLIVGLGAWVLDRSCRDWTDWLPLTGAAPLAVAVNVSGRQLMHPDFLDALQQLLARTTIRPASLVLELTENVFLDDSHRTEQVLTGLRALGVRLALDDFGTGYSSLGYLQRFPVDILKIDKAFVKHIGQDRAATAIATAIIQLAQALGITVTAEGVETDRQRRTLTEIGCQHAQGHLYSRPLPHDQLCSVLRLGDGAPHLPPAGSPERTARTRPPPAPDPSA